MNQNIDKTESTEPTNVQAEPLRDDGYGQLADEIFQRITCNGAWHRDAQTAGCPDCGMTLRDLEPSSDWPDLPVQAEQQGCRECSKRTLHTSRCSLNHYAVHRSPVLDSEREQLTPAEQQGEPNLVVDYEKDPDTGEVFTVQKTDTEALVGTRTQAIREQQRNPSKEVTAVMVSKAAPEGASDLPERKYSGDLWIDPDGTANFRFHIEGGGFTEARHALEKFIYCLQDKLNRTEECPYTEKVANRCTHCGKEFFYSYESDK